VCKLLLLFNVVIGVLSAGSAYGQTPIPVLIQHVSSSDNPIGISPPVLTPRIPLPNPVQAGDALVLGITYLHGKTITITDTLGNTWPPPAVVADNGEFNHVTAVYVLLNSRGGPNTITVNWSGAAQPFQYVLSEYNNVVGVSGTHKGIGLHTVASVIRPGPFTPAENNAGGGNVIWNYTALAATNNGLVTRWAAGTQFSLLNADNAWMAVQGVGFNEASQAFLQPLAASIAPRITAIGDTEDPFNSVTVALKVGEAGGSLPAGIHVRKIIHLTNAVFPGNSVWRVQVPSLGNMRVISGPFDVANVTRVTDSDGNVYTRAGPNQTIWYSRVGTVPNPNLILSIFYRGDPPTLSIRFYDIDHATGFDKAADNTTACSSVTSISNKPTITPTHAPGLVIAAMSIGQGPGTAVTSPAGAFWDLVTYSGEVDTDLMENADAAGHFYNPTTATENWTWAITSNGNNTCTAEAIAIH